MISSLPQIAYKSDIPLDIEVMTFAQTQAQLNKTEDHDPFSPHKIQFYLILIVTKDFYTHYVDFKFYELKKGSILFIAKNQVHHFTENFQNIEGFCILLNSQFLEQNYFLSNSIHLDRLYNYHLETPLVTLEGTEGAIFLETVQNLYVEYHLEGGFAKAEMLRAYLHILLIKAERVKQLHSTSSVKTLWLEVFNTFKNSLEVNYITTRNSKFYAEELSVSYKFLNDVVKKLTGKTVKAFIDDFVTIEIKRYLLSTSLSVKEICYKTGFDEPANMTKFFKKNTQITPLKFRQQV
ncbi:AraC family transcriptional regulator [Cellulophaga baltica]|uniref:Transcriptional regulator, AraC family n=1 Tax=Cellulophaga baltica TaxID=76594 RepID=A0A1G7GHJ3_9FLAO|nr:helix-turn-helix transcriptional regulator [Cellulophaga baltica]SDE87553.1 transcriptional regulator, AraC family [Cellulophaga baltica]